MLNKSLIPWNESDLSPFRMLRDMEREIDRMWDSLRPARRSGSYTFDPACDVEETDFHYVISVDLPGISKDNVHVDLTDNRLTISGERNRETDKKDESGAWVERSYGKFTRSFSLPQAVHADQVEASFENGVLNVVVPKAEAARPHQIKVQEGRGSLLKRLFGAKKEALKVTSEMSDKSQVA